MLARLPTDQRKEVKGSGQDRRRSASPGRCAIAIEAAAEIIGIPASRSAETCPDTIKFAQNAATPFLQAVRDRPGRPIPNDENAYLKPTNLWEDLALPACPNVKGFPRIVAICRFAGSRRPQPSTVQPASRAGCGTTSSAAWHTAGSPSWRRPAPRPSSPRREERDANSRTPIAFIAGIAGSRSSASSAFTSSTAPLFHHPVEPAFDVAVKCLAVRQKHVSARAFSSSISPSPGLGLPGGNRLAGGFQHFQRPHDALAVGRPDRHRRFRVLAPEKAMQLFRPFFRHAVPPACPAQPPGFPASATTPLSARESKALCRRRKSAPARRQPDRPSRRAHRRASGRSNRVPGMDMAVEPVRRARQFVSSPGRAVSTRSTS
jgi:hypothetical protein